MNDRPYGLCKKIIAKGNFNKTELLDKLDVLLFANRITDEQYKELVSMIGE